MQTALNDSELLKRCKEVVYALTRSNGQSWKVTIPADVYNDPDIILTELIERYEFSIKADQERRMAVKENFIKITQDL